MITTLLELGNYIGKITRDKEHDLPDTLVLMRPAATGEHGFIPSSSIRLQGWSCLIVLANAILEVLVLAMQKRNSTSYRLDTTMISYLMELDETTKKFREILSQKITESEAGKP